VAGTPFGRYQLQTLLGRGGMGEVWRAHDTATNRVVALKVLPPHLADDRVFQERFRREAQLAAGLYEPHIVPIHNFGEIDGRLYVDMRLIEGRDLEAMLGEGPLAPSRAVKIVEQIASALQAAHAAGLVHRDVKPSNVLVTSSDFAYLIDFGIARTLGGTGLTATGSAIGTWAYMAPERFGAGKPDARSDVYALTCVLHQTLTGERPFPGDSVEQQVAGHLSTPPPRPSRVKNGLPHALDDVIARGMAKNPDERYATAVALSDAAQAAVTAPTHAVSPPTQAAGFDAAATAVAHLNMLHPSSSRESGAEPGAPASAETQYRTPGFTMPGGAPQRFYGAVPAKPQRRAFTKPRVLAPVLLVLIALVAGAVWVSMRHGDTRPNTARPHPPISQEQLGPQFDGVFTANFTAQQTFSGKPRKGVTPNQNWLIRSACRGNRCVATASQVGAGGYTSSLVFDYVDGRWLAVAEGASATDCSGGNPSPRWVVFSLKGNSDKLTGTYSTIGETGCGRRSTVTFTRTGDAHENLVDDPSKQPPRVVSPASALRGRYHYESTNSVSTPQDYVAGTDCLRSGARCISSFTDPTDGSSQQFLFADGKWTRHSASDSKCKSGNPQHNEWVIDATLPEPPQDPISLWKTHEHVEMTGSCSSVKDYDATFTRTGE
jgi:hypothetical protein